MPDITEAIPVDNPSDASPDAKTADDVGLASERQADGERAGTPSPPNVSTGDRHSPAQGTMESGSNADGGREPDPSRMKLLPAD